MSGYTKYPDTCNLCGGRVIFTTNDTIYGKKYGSGYCYFCTECKSYVGTHKDNPKVSMGILANPAMRRGKKACHAKFDVLWNDASLTVAERRKRRKRMYGKLAHELGIPMEECHFGYFDLKTLVRAYKVLERWEKDKVQEG